MKGLLNKDWKYLIEKFVLRKHQYEPRVKAVLKQIRGNLFVDIGANRGLYSRMLASNFKQIIAFEPNPYVLPLLKKKLPLNVIIESVALSNEEGATTLHFDDKVRPFGGAGKILPPYRGEKSSPVRTQTYDSFFKDQRADLVKIDVEEAEFLVLEGMRESLNHDQIKNLLVELHHPDRSKELEQVFPPQYTLSWVDHNHLYALLNR